MLDDTDLRSAAATLLAAARQAEPRVAWGLHAVELGTAKIIVEIEVGPNGPRATTLLLDTDGPEQSILFTSVPL
jgi:hypothetical protein